MKFLCLTLCQGEVCTDTNADANKNVNDDANNDANDDNDAQSMIIWGSLVDTKWAKNEPVFYDHLSWTIKITGKVVLNNIFHCKAIFV